MIEADFFGDYIEFDGEVLVLEGDALIVFICTVFGRAIGMS